MDNKHLRDILVRFYNARDMRDGCKRAGGEGLAEAEYAFGNAAEAVYQLGAQVLEEREPPSTPTLDRRREVIKESQSIGEFLDWLSEQGIQLCVMNEERFPARFIPASNTDPSSLLHRYFDIDPEEEDRELRSIIDHVRELNERERP